MRILILGDSFCYVPEGQQYHWVKMLGEYHDIENASYPGIGQFKIWKQFSSQTYDVAIIHHTSPYRVHARYNPVHGGIRNKSDFMLNDIKYHASKGNRDAKLISDYLTKYVDFEYQEEIHKLVCEKMLTIPRSIHFTMFDNVDTPHNFNDIFIKHRDSASPTHLDRDGHVLVFERIKSLVDKYRG